MPWVNSWKQASWRKADRDIPEEIALAAGNETHPQLASTARVLVDVFATRRLHPAERAKLVQIGEQLKAGKVPLVADMIPTLLC